MAAQVPVEDQTAQLKKQADLLAQELELLKQQLSVLKAQAELDSAKQSEDAKSAKALLDTLKDQITSQYGLATAQAQLPFAELQGIKAGISGLTLPTGKEGTVKVAAGTAGTALLRSKKPILELLDKVADQLTVLCPRGAVLLTEAQLGQAYMARFTLKQIADEQTKLENAAKDAMQMVPTGAPGVAGFPAAIAGAYTLGFTLDTINGLVKLLRTNRQLDVFSADAEGIEILGYLLESKKKGFDVNLLGENPISEADSLMVSLRALATKLQKGNETLAKVKKYSDDIAKAPANSPIKQAEKPSDETINILKTEMEIASSLLDRLNPSKNPDSFWAQVNGQLLSAKIEKKQRLFLEVKAQAVQVTESRWYTSDRILATGEIQVGYRIFNPDGSLENSGIIMKASSPDKARIDKLEKLEWPIVKQEKQD